MHVTYLNAVERITRVHVELTLAAEKLAPSTFHASNRSHALALTRRPRARVRRRSIAESIQASEFLQIHLAQRQPAQRTGLTQWH